MPKRKNSVASQPLPQFGQPLSSAGPIIWYGTRAEYEAVLNMRQGQLDVLIKTKEALAARGVSNIILESNIVSLEIMVADLKKWMDEAKE